MNAVVVSCLSCSADTLSDAHSVQLWAVDQVRALQLESLPEGRFDVSISVSDPRVGTEWEIGQGQLLASECCEVSLCACLLHCEETLFRNTGGMLWHIISPDIIS